MYIPKLYRNDNADEIFSFIEKSNFGILVTQNNEQKTIATHIPFVVEKKNDQLLLTSHMSRANEQWKNFGEIRQVLVIFTGGHSYISSSWYDHINVPTWDYIAVHVYGSIHILDHEATLQHLDQLVSQHEASESAPVSLHSMGAGYVAKEMKGLVAFYIVVNEIYSAFKLSQNRDEKNIDRIITELEKRGDENSLAIAEAIKKQRKV